MKKLLIAALVLPLLIVACSKPADTASNASDTGGSAPKSDAPKTDPPKSDAPKTDADDSD